VAIVQGPDGDELSINGQKGISNNIAVDGADFNNPFLASSAAASGRPSRSTRTRSARSLSVADGAAPEFGRSGSGFVNVVTKSGTNRLSGSAHLFGKSDGVSSANSNGQKFAFNQEQFGATLGGPLKRDKTFYFMAYDETASARPSRPIRPASIRGWSPSSRRSAALTRTGRSSGPTTPASCSARSTTS